MMRIGCPDKLKIELGEGHIRILGRHRNGRQILLVPLHKRNPADDSVRSFFCTFWFDMDGVLVGDNIEEYEFPVETADFEWSVAFNSKIAALEPLSYGEIIVRPFQIERFGVIFGLVPVAPQEPDDPWYVVLEPGCDAVFQPPWDGAYAS